MTRPWTSLIVFCLTALTIWAYALQAMQGMDNQPHLGWQAVGVTPMHPYADLDLTRKQYEYLQAGHNPYTDGSYNESGIKANYSRAMLWAMWRWYDAWGCVPWAGTAMLAVTCALLAGLCWGAPAAAGMCMALGLGMGSGALGLERGNSDQMVAWLVAGLAVLPWQLDKRGQHRLAVGLFGALAGLGILLKLFPLFALPAALAFTQRQHRWQAVALGLLAAGIYQVADWQTLPYLFGNTPSSAKYSYGIPGMLLLIKKGALHTALRLGLTATVLATGLWAAWRWLEALRPTRTDWRYSLCLAGAGIFAATFLLSASYNYRLLFLLLTVPYLALQGRRVGWTLLAGVLVYMLWPFVEYKVKQRLPLEGLLKITLWSARQTVGLALAALAVAWLAAQAWLRLQPGQKDPASVGV